MTRGLHFGVCWDLSALPSTRKTREDLSPGRTQGRSAGGCSQRRRGNSGGAPLPAPSRSLLPGPTAAAWARGGCQTLRSTGCLGSLRLGRTTLFLCRRDCSKAANMCVWLFQKPRGPWPLGAPCVVRARRSPWRHRVRSVGRCPARPRPLLSVTPACPSQPASNPSWSTNFLESAQPFEATRSLLDAPYNNSKCCRLKSGNDAAADPP